MENIYSYSDYRKYIRDYHSYQKSIRYSFTYRVLSARAGINSSGFYPLVVQGKRNLTDATIKKTSVALELTPVESEYFSNLVHFNQAKTLKKKNMYFNRLLEVLNKKDLNTLTEDQYDIFSEWYHGVIRELVICQKFDNDFRKLGAMLSPPITAKQARKSVELLLKLGFIQTLDGKYIQTSPVLTTRNNLKSHQIMNYQLKMLKLAQEAFDRFGSNELLSNSSTTFRISRETFELFKIKNRNHRDELLKIAEQDENADQVFQLNINMFPVSNPKNKGNKNA